MYLVQITNASQWWVYEYPLLFQTEEEAVRYVTDMCEIIKADNIRFIEEVLVHRFESDYFDVSEYAPYLYKHENRYYHAKPNMEAISMSVVTRYMRKDDKKVHYQVFSIPVVNHTWTKYFAVMPIELKSENDKTEGMIDDHFNP